MLVRISLRRLLLINVEESPQNSFTLGKIHFLRGLTTSFLISFLGDCFTDGVF